jgi:molecular chaperone GrpE
MAKKITLKDLQIQIKDLTEKWKRALADYANLEKRIEQEKTAFVKFSNAGLIDKILSVLDDLERAEAHLKNKGLTIAVDQLRAVLKTEGLEEIKAEREKFNPEKMDCLEMVSGERNKVMAVAQKGYLLHNKVLRPAKVKVGKGD